MSLQLKKVLPAVLKGFIKHELATPVNKFETSVLDYDAIQALMTKPDFKKGRECWGFYYGGVLCGYAVVYRPEDSLDLLYVGKAFRGKQIAKSALQQLHIRKTVVDPENQIAMAFYLSQGIEVESIY